MSCSSVSIVNLEQGNSNWLYLLSDIFHKNSMYNVISKKKCCKNSMGSEKLPLLFYSYVLVNSHICLRKKEIHQTSVVFKMLTNH